LGLRGGIGRGVVESTAKGAINQVGGAEVRNKISVTLSKWKESERGTDTTSQESPSNQPNGQVRTRFRDILQR
jgi:hypothetical protein